MNSTPSSSQQFQQLIQHWLSQLDTDEETRRVGSQDQLSKDHWNRQSKHMKDITSKLNKLERQLMRQESGVLKTNSNNNNRPNQLQRLLQRATLSLTQNNKNSHLQKQISAIYNAAASQLERRNKLENTLGQLSKAEKELEEELVQAGIRKQVLQQNLAVIQASHRLTLNNYSRDL